MALVLVFFLLILIMAFIFGDRGLLEIIKTQNQITAMKKTIRELESEKLRLQKEIAMLRDNPLALEQA
jgi:cell division protein FtsB